MNAPEEWRPVPDYPGYDASSFGRIRSWVGTRGRRLNAPHLIEGSLRATRGDSAPYRDITIRGRRVRAHKLVALAFLGPMPADATLVRHIDDDPANNRPENLAYGTVADNAADAVRNGRHPWASRSACSAGHVYTPETVRVRNGRRACLVCERGHWRKYQARKRLERQAVSA